MPPIPPNADGDGNPNNCLYGQLTVTTEYTYVYDDNWQLTKCIEAGEYKGTTVGRDSDTQYYLYDGLGSVTRIASEYGRIKETYSYDPYGNLTYDLPDSINYYGYNGESTNLFTGLQYLRARYYNMENGSFLSEDTYAGQASQPLTLNRYTYVSNNPVNHIDPSGHKIKDRVNNVLKNAGNKIADSFETVTEFVSDGVNSIKNTFTGNNSNSSLNMTGDYAMIPYFSAGVHVAVSESGNGFSAGVFATHNRNISGPKIASEDAEEIQDNQGETASSEEAQESVVEDLKVATDSAWQDFCENVES